MKQTESHFYSCIFIQWSILCHLVFLDLKEKLPPSVLGKLLNWPKTVHLDIAN